MFKVVKRIVTHALLALDYIHRECGIAHTGNSYLVAPVPLTETLRSQIDIQLIDYGSVKDSTTFLS